MNNTWNKIMYRIWSPIYDQIFNTGPFLEARKKVFQDVKFEKHSNLLFVGVGTGADLELFNPQHFTITAIDLSPDMLEKARKKYPDSAINFLEMDAQKLNFDDNQFDFVIASLILSVVPDPNTCLREMARVLKNSGELIIFDKFSSTETSSSIQRRLARPFVKLLGTDIALSFEALFEKNKRYLKLIDKSPVMFNGFYTKIRLRKE